MTVPVAIDRRAVLAGIGTTIAAPATASSAADDRLRAALDRAATLPPGDALRSLRGVDATGLSPALLLDLGAARGGLAIDARLAAIGARALVTASDHVGEGADVYALRLGRGLGDGIDPARAFHRLTCERRRLLVRADRLFGRIGRSQGDIGARYAAIWHDADALYADDDRGRADAAADMNRTLRALRRDVAAMVGPVPAWCLDVAVRRLSPTEQAAGRGGYRVLPTPTTPGAYVVDLGDIRRRPRWSLPSVVAHEALPGHLLQLGIEAETPPHPLRIDYARAFVEGWAIHAETLAARTGFHEDDPRVELGHVHWLLFRVARALVDLGLHLHGWTIPEARGRFIAWLGEPAYFASFDTELARIPQEPAARAAEAIAWLTIADTAAPTPGFHRALLTGGRKRVEQWPRAQIR